MKRQRKGFTLVELAIVIAILGILAVVAIPKYQGMEDQARSSAAKAQLGTVRSAIGISYAKNKGTFPSTISGGLFADGVMPSVVLGGTSNSSAVALDTASNSSAITVSGTAGGWKYKPYTGEVRINSTATDPANPPTTWNSY